jgi:hypothetical protein
MGLEQHRRGFYRFVSSLPIGSRAGLFVTIFCLFATFGFVSDVVSVGRHPTARIALDVVLSGVMAVLYSFIGGRSGRALTMVGGVQIAIVILISRWSPVALADTPVRTGDDLARRLSFDAFGIAIGVMVGYSALTRLLTREGSKFLRLRTEVGLAQDIHRRLVPAFSGRHSGIEFSGVAYPSGEVGGDLVDAISTADGRWIGYIADVAGHGVQAGVVLAMVKSVVRMAVARGASVDAILEQSNEVLMPLLAANMFVTAAVVQIDPTGVEVATAGHLPLLHYKAVDETVAEVHIQNFALGFFADSRYSTAHLTCARGDVLLCSRTG